MSKRCELQKEYYKVFGNYKGEGKYTDHYVKWLEDKVLKKEQTMSNKTEIKEYVAKWMEEHESDTFVKNKQGNVIYSAGHSSINLVAFFERLLEDYVNEMENKQ